MKQAPRFGFVAVAALVMQAAGCGGGGDGGNASAGIDRGGITIARGPINGFGSVIVNGVHYSTAGATITIDGQPGTESDLRVGQVVRVAGTIDAGGASGTARSIDFDDEVEGPIGSVDLAASSFSVLGQVVQVGPGTSFDDSIVPRGLDGLAVGQRVEVSGLVDSAGVIVATRIERKDSAGAVEVKGTASDVDTAAKTLRINSLQVDYATAVLDGFAAGQPATGDLLEAEGTVDGAGVLVADRLERESTDLDGSIDDDADLEGLVTRFVSAADFDVAGQRVTTTSSTQFEGGTAADLALDASVGVEGGFDSTGRVVADLIEFRREGDVEISATVEAVDGTAGIVTVLGVDVRTTPITRMEDHSSADVALFDVTDLAVGDRVEIHAYVDGTVLVALLLDREDPESGVELQGIASDLSPPGFSIVGVAVTTDAGTEFLDAEGLPIAAADFFAAAAGRVVEVHGTLVGGTVLAERAEIED